MRTLYPILFGTKKGHRENPGVYGIFSVALKTKAIVFLLLGRKGDMPRVPFLFKATENIPYTPGFSL